MIDITNLVTDFKLVENRTLDNLEAGAEIYIDEELDFDSEVNLDYDICIQFDIALDENNSTTAISMYFDADCLIKLRDALNNLDLR